MILKGYAVDNILRDIKKGSVFIYPTDTIYGIGCNAKLDDAVDKIRQLKKRPKQPFSIIAPSREWIVKNCETNLRAKKWINKLPGAYTLILKLKEDSSVSKLVNPGINTVGVRIPDHWFTHVVKEAKTPIITTSVNRHGENYMTELDDLDKDFKNNVDYIFFDGTIKGTPSTIVDLTKEKIEVKKRK